MEKSLCDLVSTTVNPNLFPSTLLDKKSVESLSYTESIEMFSGMEEEFKSVEFFLNSFSDEKSSERFFSKETFAKVMSEVIQKLKYLFAKIIIIITNFIKKIQIFIGGLVVKKQDEDYTRYKSTLDLNKYKDVEVTGLVVKDRRVFIDSKRIVDNLEKLSTTVDILTNKSAQKVQEIKNFLASNDKSDHLSFFKGAGIEGDAYLLYLVKGLNGMKFASLSDMDVFTYIRKFDLERTDQLQYILKGPKTVAYIYIYGEDGFENAKDILNQATPVFKKPYQMTLKSYLKNTDIEEFDCLSMKSANNLKRDMTNAQNLVNGITRRAATTRRIMADLEKELDEIAAAYKDGILSKGFSYASKNLKVVISGLSQLHLINHFITGVLLSYYTEYFKHRNQLHVALNKCVNYKIDK